MTVRKYYDPNEMAEMRRQGYTLQAIGDTLGITREAVRIRLKRHYPGIKPELLSEGEVAQRIGCNTIRLAGLRKRGIVHPVRMGAFWRYDEDEIAKAVKALTRYCRRCGQLLPSNHLSFCEECGVEVRRYNYPWLSEQSKKKCGEASVRWRKRNPEKTKELDKRAGEKWRRKHFEQTTYEVIYPNDVLPVGTRFKAMGWKDYYFILEDGSRIVARCVRIVREG